MRVPLPPKLRDTLRTMRSAAAPGTEDVASRSLRIPREDRMDICRACEFAKPLRAGLLQCGKCGCVCQFKTAVPSAKCPVGKW